jgi:NodT family efflux transporter outer membrane factor (OMF) lipoprotein
VPSLLLERRPDIAGAERRMAAANAQIGVAVAAYFPSLTLSGSYGYSSFDIGQLLRASNNIWSVGPQLAQTLFDGGLRRAQEAEARATYDQTTAEYRQTVLAGFQQVEDQLAALRILGQQAEVQANAVASAQEAERLILNQYKAGTIAYTSVVTAQTAALSNEQTALTLRQNQLTASVTLIQALGGGWDASELPAIGQRQDDKAGTLAKE